MTADTRKIIKRSTLDAILTLPGAVVDTHRQADFTQHVVDADRLWFCVTESAGKIRFTFRDAKGRKRKYATAYEYFSDHLPTPAQA